MARGVYGSPGAGTAHRSIRRREAAVAEEKLASRNVMGGRLETCGKDPVTGFYRSGCCETGPDDLGVHTVCAIVTGEFLAFSKERGNDLSTPRPGFSGLRPGDPWCLCALRWAEAERHGVAPPIMLAATHEATLRLIPLETLLPYALDREMVQG